LNYGRLLNNVRAQDAQFQSLVTAYQNSVLTAGAEVENGLVFFLKAHVRVKALSESVRAAQKAANIALVQYRNGVVDFNRVALLQQNLVQQQDLLAQATGDIALGLIQVYKALGGGWQIRCNGCSSELPAVTVQPVASSPAPAATELKPTQSPK
jgi:outer membrane protein TolC